MERLSPKNPDFFRWACERGSTPIEVLQDKKGFSELGKWVSGTKYPTEKQLESFCKKLSVPIGMYWATHLPERPPLPIEDFRTIGSTEIQPYSRELLDTLHIYKLNQLWYRGYMISEGYPPLSFLNSVTTNDSSIDVAQKIRSRLRFPESPDDIMNMLVSHAEEENILVMKNGVVGIDTHRPLEVKEFRGFSLVDRYASFIFINGKDSKTAQLFTLAHELAHIWLGKSALSDSSLDQTIPQVPDVEKWCNQVAAELLVPKKELKQIVQRVTVRPETEEYFLGIAKTFHVSPQVVLRRLYDLRYIKHPTFKKFYDQFDRYNKKNSSSSKSGGNFYATHRHRFNHRFIHAVLDDAAQGNTSYRDAYRLLYIKTTKTFNELMKQVGSVQEPLSG